MKDRAREPQTRRERRPLVGPPRFPWSKRFAIGVIVIVVGAVGTWSAKYLVRLNNSAIAPPLPDLNAATRAVTELVSEHRDRVLREPRSGIAWGHLGMVYLAHQFEPEAAQCFEQAEKLDPTDYRWPYLWALTLGVVDPQRAEHGYLRAIELKPGAAHAHTRLGELLLAAERYQEADGHFARAMRSDEHDARSRLGASRIALRQNELAAALRLAQDAARLAPETREVHEWLARLHHLSGDREAARQELALAAQFEQSDLPWNDPVTAEVVVLRRDAHWILQEAAELAQHQQLDRAIRQVISAIDDDDRDPQLHVALADYLIQRREFDQAGQFLAKALKRHPTAVELRFKLGVVEFLKQRYPEAQRHFLAVLAARPDHYLAHYNLAHTYLKQVEPDRALEAFLRAAEVRPDLADAHANAATLLIAKGRKAEAIEHLKTVVRLKPNDAKARKMLKASSHQQTTE